MIRASVVLTTFNDDHRLERTLWGWAGQTCRDFELTIVNDGGDLPGGNDPTEKLCASFCPRTLMNYAYFGPEKKGREIFRLAAARNIGLRMSEGETCIISDCDTIPHPQLVENILKNARPNRVLIGTRKRIQQQFVAALKPEHFVHLETLVGETKDERLSHPEWAKTFNALKDIAPTGSWALCWGCLFAVPTKLMKDLGGFDERFQSWGGEDEDMAERLVRGKNCVFYTLPEVVVYHQDHPPRDRSPYQAAAHLEEIRKSWTPIRNGGPIT